MLNVFADTFKHAARTHTIPLRDVRPVKGGFFNRRTRWFDPDHL